LNRLWRAEVFYWLRSWGCCRLILLSNSSDLFRVAEVAFDARTAGADALYTYRAPAEAMAGQAWLAPLGPRRIMGWIMNIKEVTEEELGFSPARLKPLDKRILGLDLPAQLLSLIHSVSEEFLASISETLTPATPPGIQERLVRTWTPVEGAESPLPLSAAQEEGLKVMKEGPVTETKTKPIAKGFKSALRALVTKGLADETLSLTLSSTRARLGGVMRLTADELKIETFLRKEGRRKPAQAMTLLQLQGTQAASFPADEIKALAGCTDQTIKSLVKAGLLEEVEEGPSPVRVPPQLNPHQAEAVAALSEAVAKGEAKGFLLYGVTGSGKTEVYLRTAAEALRMGRQVLYLVPEIALTAQVIAQLRERFGRSVAILHSSLSPRERLDNWMRVQSGMAPLILGARSALFAPLSRLGLIVMDEEHEGSYKQENSPRYQGRKVVEMLAELHQCPYVLGSATPSIETYHDALEGRLQLLRLPNRAAQAVLPEVKILDLTEGYKTGQPSAFAPPLAASIEATLKEGRQVILFLNRRAYAKFLVCRQCGHKWGCPHCAVTLAYHQKDNRLKCHQCDHTEVHPTSCPQCGGMKIRPLGVGSEKVEEEVKKLFPLARVGRLDRDVVRRKGALEDILTKFRAGELNVLVGTQMVAKGLDFPNVTLVGVIAADISLNVPDFRASERTFQLLSQVAGRAGRGQHAGVTYIQTFKADHPSLLAAQTHNYESIFHEILAERKEVGYPPFRRLVNILITGPNLEAVNGMGALAKSRLAKALPEATILGPVDCVIEKIQGQWRRHLVLKLEPGADVKPIQKALEDLHDPGARLIIDVDPATLL
jgi:primosomal protein N' (replication factor Y) (superfamily II helicase)